MTVWLGTVGDWLADHIAPLAALAVVLALVVPSATLARRSDVLLGVLVLFTAMLIEPRRLLGLRANVVSIAALSVGTLLVLTIVAWLIGRAFDGSVRDGILSLGLASTEVASVGLISLAGGDSVLALGVLTGSLICAAILGPLLAGLLAQTAGHATSLSLLGRFALVVIAPLAVGLAIRGARPALQRSEGSLNGLSALTVCVLLYAALSGVGGGHQLAQGGVRQRAVHARHRARGTRHRAARASPGHSGGRVDQLAAGFRGRRRARHPGIRVCGRQRRGHLRRVDAARRRDHRDAPASTSSRAETRACTPVTKEPAHRFR